MQSVKGYLFGTGPDDAEAAQDGPKAAATGKTFEVNYCSS